MNKERVTLSQEMDLISEVAKYVVDNEERMEIVDVSLLYIKMLKALRQQGVEVNHDDLYHIVCTVQTRIRQLQERKNAL